MKHEIGQGLTSNGLDQTAPDKEEVTVSEKKGKIIFSKKLRRTAAEIVLGATLFFGAGAFIAHSSIEAETPSAIPGTTSSSQETTSKFIQTRPTTEQQSPETAETPATDTTEQDIPTINTDVVVYGNDIGGAGAIRETEETPDNVNRPNIVYIGTANCQQDPVSNGLSLEDRYNLPASGFYKEFTNFIVSEYAPLKINPLQNGKRLAYEPEKARDALNWFTQRSNVTYLSATLVSASDQNGESYVIVDVVGKGKVKIIPKCFVDTSVEGDLAKMLGADYKIGQDETDVFNDVKGIEPPKPTAENNYITAPQAISELLTLKVYPKRTKAPLVRNQSWPFYIKDSYNVNAYKGTINLKAFANSWSMKTALVPDSTDKKWDKRELNEVFTDDSNPTDSFDWEMGGSVERTQILTELVTDEINKVRYLQENGYPNIGITNVSQYPYIREGVRFVGKTEYTEDDITNGAKNEVITREEYALSDIHDPIKGNNNTGDATVNIPLGTIEPVGHPNLLVTSAIDCTSLAYSSAVRMQTTRADLGGVAGLIVTIAFQEGKNLQDVTYNELEPALLQHGYKL